MGNEVIFMEIRINRKDLLNNYYRLLLTPPSNTNNQQLISRRLSFRRGLHTSLGLLLLCCCRCQILQPFGTTILSIRPRFIECDTLGLSVQLSTCRMDQDFNIFHPNLRSKLNPPSASTENS